MNAALIAVRSIAGAKNRLAEVLAAAEREELTLAMLADMIDSLGRARTLETTYVVSADEELRARAAAMGAVPLSERELIDAVPSASPAALVSGGLNRAVAAAARELAARGVRRLLTIPGDVPLVDAEEIDSLLTQHTGEPHVTLIPSRSGTGTNGLITSPPAVIVPRFEGRSLEAHRRECAGVDVPCRIAQLAGFALDVDTADDLEQLADGPRSRRSVRVAIDLERARGASTACTG